jgi:hypothetical protein
MTVSREACEAFKAEAIEKAGRHTSMDPVSQEHNQTNTAVSGKVLEAMMLVTMMI